MLIYSFADDDEAPSPSLPSFVDTDRKDVIILEAGDAAGGGAGNEACGDSDVSIDEANGGGDVGGAIKNQLRPMRRGIGTGSFARTAMVCGGLLIGGAYAQTPSELTPAGYIHIG